jgi:UDP-N-acetylmuramoyl-L-alanyl-D-glutamate--2,6-diaminopimelate ligase
MTLRDLLGNDAPDVEVSGLAYSSRSVFPGTLFFCVPGFRADGHDFAPEAVARGAVALVCQRPLGLGVPEVIVDDVRAAMGPAAARFYGDPTAELEVVGVTGTNGKTTTAFLLQHLLEGGGRQTGLLGTVKRVVGGVEEEVERTTPEAIDLQATFRAMLDGGDRACAMEVSSHALELGRVAGIRFACRIFTNLTQDHLDFHETMEAYFAAKRRLFEDPGLSVVNVDDEYGRRIAAEVECVTFGVERDADYRAREIEFDLMGSRFVCETPDGELALSSPAPWPRRACSGCRGRRSRPRCRPSAACPAASSLWTRARTSACWWTTPTRRRRSRTCWWRRGRSRAVACTWCSARAATATAASAP